MGEHVHVGVRRASGLMAGVAYRSETGILEYGQNAVFIGHRLREPFERLDPRAKCPSQCPEVLIHRDRLLGGGRREQDSWPCRPSRGVVAERAAHPSGDLDGRLPADDHGLTGRPRCSLEWQGRELLRGHHQVDLHLPGRELKREHPGDHTGQVRLRCSTFVLGDVSNVPQLVEQVQEVLVI